MRGKAFGSAAPVAAIFLLVFLATPLISEAPLIIDITVAPNVLNLSSQGDVVTVHTNLPYSQVLGATVSLNNTAISWWKSDNRGYFVAKFQMRDIKNLPLTVDAYNTLTLSGVTVNNQAFTGSAQVMVVNNTSSAR